MVSACAGIRLGKDVAMGRKIPVPCDFWELAPDSSTAELAKAYGYSVDTIRRWRRECGLPPSKRNRTPIDSGQYRGMDTPEQIQYCLCCPVAKCYGYKCPILPKVRKRKRKKALSPGSE